MNKLDRYVLLTFLRVLLVVAGGILGIFTVLDFLGHGDELSASSELMDGVAGKVTLYYLLNLPFLWVQFAPYLTLIAGMTTVLQFAKKREWTPMLSAGASSGRVLAPVFLGAIIAAVFAVLLREMLLPNIAPTREGLQRTVFHQRDWLLVDLNVRTRSDQRMILNRYNPESETGYGLELYSLNHFGEDQLLQADEAKWAHGHWILENGRQISAGDLETPAEYLPGEGLHPEDLMRSYFASTSPLELSSRQLKEVLVRDSGHRQAATLLWAWRLSPLSHLVLLFVGIPFVFRFSRRSSTEGFGFGIFFCMLFFVAEIVFRDFGARGALSPALGGSGALLLFTCVGLMIPRRS
ncbi:MAG: LptF/LptG family permease [Planctomycetota bacterium]|jgi:lipopolysaccharide export system permease protein|nr:LptF/LptG family permease [Planctomycetota bacterium]MDP6940986.1 LptF/LptG family permease [Planctomycetota bacterium]